MNKNETIVREQLKQQGYKILRGGAPDFIALKVSNEEIISFKGVEVKSKNNSKLTYEQSIYKKIFEMAGIQYEVVISNPQLIVNPNQSAPAQPNSGHPKPSQTNPIQIHIKGGV